MAAAVTQPVQIEYTAAAMRVREGQLSSFRRDSLIARASDSEERTIPADSPEALPEPEASIGEVCPSMMESMLGGNSSKIGGHPSKLANRVPASRMRIAFL